MSRGESARAAGRALLRGLCRLPLPGRHLLVELTAAALAPPVPATTVIGRAVRMRCDLRDVIQRQMYYRIYEPDETPFVIGRLRPGDVFLDVGANVGYYALLAAEAVGPRGAVHAFEPVPANCAALRANVALNNLENVTTNEMAVGDGAARELTLYIRAGAENSGWASVTRSETRPGEPVRVPATTLDEFVGDRGIERVALVKIDAEGAEPLVLRGGARLLGRADAPDLAVEVNAFLLGKVGSSAAALIAQMEALGYTVNAIGAGGLRPADPQDRRAVWTVYASKHLR